METHVPGIFARAVFAPILQEMQALSAVPQQESVMLQKPVMVFLLPAQLMPNDQTPMSVEHQQGLVMSKKNVMVLLLPAQLMPMHLTPLTAALVLSATVWDHVFTIQHKTPTAASVRNVLLWVLAATKPPARI